MGWTAWAATLVSLPTDVWLAMAAYVGVDVAVHRLTGPQPPTPFLRQLTIASVGRRNRAVRGMTLFTRLIAIVVVEAIFLVVSLLLLGSNEISYTPAPADHFCGLIVKEHVGSWYCPVTLAAS